MKKLLTFLFLSSLSLVAVCSHVPSAPSAPINATTTPTTQTYSPFPAGATQGMMDMAAEWLAKESQAKRDQERKEGYVARHGSTAPVLAPAARFVLVGGVKRTRDDNKH